MSDKATPSLYINSPDELEAEEGSTVDPMLYGDASLVSYVLDKALEWESYLDTNYREKWEEYSRIWRGQWDSADVTRDQEKCRIVAPASAQAVESSVCEIEEATFGQGAPFDMKDDKEDQNPADVEYIKKCLTEEFKKNKIRSSTAEVILCAAVYGTGIAEVVVEEKEVHTPKTQKPSSGGISTFGVETTEEVAVLLRNVLPKSCLIDPVATCIEDAHGVILDEFVPHHSILRLQEQGVYYNAHVADTDATDSDIEPDETLHTYAHSGKVRLKKYFGLVPRPLIKTASMSPSEVLEYQASEEAREDSWSDLVESIVVIANDGVLLKAVENPYMKKDRPLVAFQWDVQPGLFHGRGVVEKGYNSQKALDAELRARIDALGITNHPMMGIDATRIPRGVKPEARAGRSVLTNGNPKDILMPFKLGDVSQITFAHAAEMQKMVQQSTGAVDSSGLPGVTNGEATAAGISMSLGAIIKRQKRTLLNFQENFWLPFVEKAALRYMQFAPEKFKVQDWQFTTDSSLGIMTREYEVTQLVQLLQTTSDQSPMYPALVESIVDNMNISNREELKAILQKANQPNPQAQKMQEESHALDMGLKKAQLNYVEGQARESNSRATKYVSEARAIPEELQIKRIEAATRNLQPGVEDDNEFARRLEVAKFALAEREMNIKEDAARMQRSSADEETKARETLRKSIIGAS